MAVPQSTTDRARAAWHRRGTLLKVVSFGAIGVINTAVDFGIFWTAVQKFAVPIIAANVLSWLVAVTCSYAMNSSITFARETGRKLSWRAYATFAVSGIAGLIGNTATLLLVLNVTPLLTADAYYQLAIAKICAIAVSFLLNFTLSHFVVFRTRKRAPVADDATRQPIDLPVDPRP